MIECSSRESASASVTRAPLWSPSMKKKSGFHPRPPHQLRAQIPLQNPVHNCQLHEQRLGLATHRRAASARQTARQPGVHHGAAERIPLWWRPAPRPVLLREASSGVRSSSKPTSEAGFLEGAAVAKVVRPSNDGMSSDLVENFPGEGASVSWSWVDCDRPLASCERHTAKREASGNQWRPLPAFHSATRGSGRQRLFSVARRTSGIVRSCTLPL